ncbi:MAG: hypothetical protein NZM38_01160 [Cytophagales bacterium]|nr:hypothetical protein [Cytophagales bacterium]MDW8383358.1 hypothetical protein [Flammeovirgaceae bacterium]
MKTSTKKPRLHRELANIDITINMLGEINPNFDIDKLNEFLNKNLDDKKLKKEKNLETK